MEYIRNETIRITKDLSVTDLDFRFDKDANSIGTLLMHIAALEFKFVLNFLFKRPFNNEEKEKYAPAMPIFMHKNLIKGNPITYYQSELLHVRKQTLSQYEMIKDEWLQQEVITPMGEKIGNHLYLNKHILFDEVSHQGQIKLIKKRLQ
ncbi:DinB family protein [Aquimarina spongiae]|nr:DinB family protein [Aquimarina spongiae]